MSPKLPVITSKQLVQALRKAGFVIDHQTGSHLSLSHPDSPTRFAVIPMYNKDLRKGTLKSILRQSGMTIEQLIELL